MARKTAILICLTGIGNVSAQVGNKDIGKLKAAFTEALKADFDLVHDTVLPDKKGTMYWLPAITPKRTGTFKINHFFELRDEWGLKEICDGFEINVAPAGTKQNIASYPSSDIFNDICMADEIIVPISLEEHIESHRFSNKGGLALSRSEKFADSLLPWTIDNASGDALLCLGVSTTRALFCGGIQSAVTYEAHFEAKKPGKFNLKVGDIICPVTIVAEGEPVARLIFEHMTGSSAGKVSSHSTKRYTVETATLRVGDKMSITFLGFTDDHRHPREVARQLKVSQTDYQLSGNGYDYWLQEASR